MNVESYRRRGALDRKERAAAVKRSGKLRQPDCRASVNHSATINSDKQKNSSSNNKTLANVN